MSSAFLLLTMLSLINDNNLVNGQTQNCLLSENPEYDYYIDISDDGFNGDIAFHFSIISDDDEDNDDNDLLSGQITLVGQAWIGFGISLAGTMLGSDAIIGLPDEEQSISNPGKYDLRWKSPSGVTLMDMPYQTLIDASITQDNTTTILRFKKKLVEENEHNIDKNGGNKFLWAYGWRNELSHHRRRSPFNVDFTECINLKLKCSGEM